MDFADRMCDQIALVHEGELKLNGSLSAIKQQYAQKNISLVYEGDIGFLETSPLVEKVSDYGNATGISVRDNADIQAVLESLLTHNVIVKKFDANEISLQEIFLKVAGTDAVN